jgi:hypothetical protein
LAIKIITYFMCGREGAKEYRLKKEDDTEIDMEGGLSDGYDPNVVIANNDRERKRRVRPMNAGV